MWTCSGRSSARPLGKLPAPADPPPNLMPTPDAPPAPPSSAENLLTAESYRLIVEAMPSAVLLTDPCGRILLVNAEGEKLFGYSREELIGQPVEMLIPPRLRTSHPAQRAAYAAHAEARPMGRGRELFALRKDGSEMPVEIGLNPISTPCGPLVLAVVIDITERKLAEASEARLAAIVEQSDDAIAGQDLHGRVVAWNTGAERLFGYSAAEMIGQSISLLLPPERVGEDLQIIAEIAQGHGLRLVETIRVRKDGRPIDVSITVSPIRDKTGRVVGASKVWRDITERKAAEATIRQLNADLERRVALRTQQLEAANKELEAFSYSVSHDLRAPLRAVDGFSQALAEDCASLLPEEGRHYLRTIRDSAQRMGALIDDLLVFSRLGRQSLKMRPIQMGRLVQTALDELCGPREGRQIDLRIGELPPCQGDPALLKQVWINLLSNAIKYTRHRPLALIEVGCTPEGAYFVRDNGTGFDMRYADKLFQVFQRFHRAEDFEGTGVGLAIVQRVVQRHGGRVWADAQVDRGAIFYFTLEENVAL